jgi:hypothetical protein
VLWAAATWGLAFGLAAVGARADMAPPCPSSLPDSDVLAPPPPPLPGCGATPCEGAACPEATATEVGAFHDYDILGIVNARLYNIQVCARGTRVGIDCPHPPADQGHCGVAILDNARYRPDTVLAAAKVRFRPKPRTDRTNLFTLLANEVPPSDASYYCLPDDPEDPLRRVRRRFTPPILRGSADGAFACRLCAPGDSGCDNGCMIDPSLVEEACGFPQAPPGFHYSPCRGGGDVVHLFEAPPNPTSAIVTISGRQTLPAGRRYERVVVATGATLDLETGGYEICRLSVGQNARVTVPPGGSVRLHVSEVSVLGGAVVGVPSDTGLQPEDVFAGCPATPVGLAMLAYGSGRLTFAYRVALRAHLCAPNLAIRFRSRSRVAGRLVARHINAGRDMTFVRCPN